MGDSSRFRGCVSSPSVTRAGVLDRDGPALTATGVGRSHARPADGYGGNQVAAGRTFGQRRSIDRRSPFCRLRRRVAHRAPRSGWGARGGRFVGRAGRLYPVERDVIMASTRRGVGSHVSGVSAPGTFRRMPRRLVWRVASVLIVELLCLMSTANKSEGGRGLEGSRLNQMGYCLEPKRKRQQNESNSSNTCLIRIDPVLDF